MGVGNVKRQEQLTATRKWCSEALAAATSGKSERQCRLLNEAADADTLDP